MGSELMPGIILNFSRGSEANMRTSQVQLFLELTATAFDLSDQTKDFANVRQVAGLVSTVNPPKLR